MNEQPQTNESTQNPIDIVEILATLWGRRKLIGMVLVTTIVLSAIVSLTLPPYFKSTATIMPEKEKGTLASLESLPSLAALAGVSVGGEVSLVKLYPTIIKSESVLRNVMYGKYKTEKFQDSVDLVRYWEITEKRPGSAFEDAIKQLRTNLDVSVEAKTSIVTISIETNERQLSADILNRTIYELNKFILTKRTTNASEQRKFIEGRLKEVKDDLSRSENALKEFRERNKQVRSPQLLLEQGRLERDVQINNTIYLELTKQYELAKIEEVKNMPVINVLDLARPAAYKGGPMRSLIVLMCALLGFLSVTSYVLGEKYYGRGIRARLVRLRLHVQRKSA